MADPTCSTASNTPRLKNRERAVTVMRRYVWDGIQAVIEHEDGQHFLSVYGFHWPRCWRVPDGVDIDTFEPDEHPASDFTQFLQEISPCLAEPLTVQAVRFEKCNYPLAACEWTIQPDSEAIEVNRFQQG